MFVCDYQFFALYAGGELVVVGEGVVDHAVAADEAEALELGRHDPRLKWVSPSPAGLALMAVWPTWWWETSSRSTTVASIAD